MADRIFAIGDRVIISAGAYASDGFPASHGLAEVIEPLDQDGDLLVVFVGDDTGTPVWVLPRFLTLALDVPEDAMTDHVQPELPFEDREPHPESLERQDPYINRRFIDLMGAEANADIARALTMGLAINDPERPSPPATPQPPRRTGERIPRQELPPHIQELLTGLDDEDVEVVALDPRDFGWTRAIQQPTRPGTPVALGHYENHDPTVVSGVDHEGDEFRAAFITADCPDHGREGAVVFRATPGGYLMHVAEVRQLIRWLTAMVDTFEQGGEE